MASAASFSYAQAAQGRVSATASKGASGAATPSTDSATSAGSKDANTADLMAKPEPAVKAKNISNGDTKSPTSASSSVTSPDPSSAKDDDGSSVQNASSESTWDSKSQSSEPTAKPVDSDKSKDGKDDKDGKDETEGSEEPAKQPKAPKPKLTDAPLPTVNPWSQRMLQNKAPAPTPVRAAAASEAVKKDHKTEPRKKSAPTSSHAQDGKIAATKSERINSSNNSMSRRESDEAPKRSASHRQTPSAAAAAAAAPAPTNDVAWPSMETAREEERRRVQEKEDKTDKDQTQVPVSKPVGKRDWNALPITPNVIFETTLPTRGSSRAGRGGPRGGAHTSGRGATASDRTGGRAQSLPNGEAPAKEQTDKADRDSMPPPPKPARSGSDGPWRDAAPFEPRAQQNATHQPANGDAPSTNGTSAEGDAAPNGGAAPKRQSSTKRGKFDSHRTADATARRSSLVSPSAPDFVEQTEDQSAKASTADRRGETRGLDNSTVPPYREANKGKRGRGGHRGGLANGGHFNHNAQTFPGEYYNAPFPPAYSQRGGHFSQNSRAGFRGSSIRSQSIPIDNFARAPAGYPGYPMQMMPAYGAMPEYYANFTPVAPYQPGAEQAYLLPQVSNQIEYYFSVENLIKDIFFRKHMDSQGYVFLSFVADFKRLKQLTTDYDLIKYVCLQSTNIEMRTGDDGRDRLRKVGDYERWVLPMGERDPTAQNSGPAQVERPAPPHLPMFEQPAFARSPPAGAYDRRFTEGYPMNGMTPAFFPSGIEPSFGDNSGSEELRGRQVKSPGRENDASPFAVGAEMDGEADTFPNEALVTLTVVVRKTAPTRAPFHNANSRTFSDGSIDSRSILEEMEKPGDKAQTNGESHASPAKVQPPGQPRASTPLLDDAAVQLFWVKDREAPVDSLPADAGHEMYTHLREKALAQRKVAATGTCPYDMDVLYQFWSHFLIRNFNAQMYAEFRGLAEQDAKARHNTVGMTNLMKYYHEALASQIPLRARVARDYLEHVQAENKSGERPAFQQLRSAWRNGATNLKNRKKLSDLIDADVAAGGLKSELES